MTFKLRELLSTPRHEDEESEEEEEEDGVLRWVPVMEVFPGDAVSDNLPVSQPAGGSRESRRRNVFFLLVLFAISAFVGGVFLVVAFGFLQEPYSRTTGVAVPLIVSRNVSA